MNMFKDANGNTSDIFPLYYGKVNLQAAAGVLAGKTYQVYCVVAGNIIVTFPSGASDPKTIAMTAGMRFSIPNGATVSLVGSAGTFHVA